MSTVKEITQKKWITGSGLGIDFYKILQIIKSHILQGSKIFIGTDSFVSNGKVCFATALCLHGPGRPGRYFFYKDKQSSNPFRALIIRITEEVNRSLELAQLLIQEYKINSSFIELHLDVSPRSVNEATSNFSDMLRGYVRGFGLNYRLKPNAWASQSIADRHSK